ncbi:MAG TPA: LysM peptidoglycan-binding domain-containing protein [Gaiellaceae bacterium]|nr:LysM peptidoglycan-binding domain-containing protein [Gaiellaceae bacterium]
MFGTRIWIILAVVVVLASAALSSARTSKGAGHELRHRVRAGETLWTIAEASYSGDPRAAIWRIEKRNGLDGADIRAGMVLYLPP